MSKERAQRRQQREAAAAAERADRQRRADRSRRLAGVRSALTGPLRRGPRRPQSALSRQRGRQNGILAAGLLGAHAALWLLTPSWWIRIGALVLTAMAWPLLVVLLFDRRSSS
jgi:Flp pilus assembly protein TadB